MSKISSFSAHIGNLQTFLKTTKIKLDVICISESRLSTKNQITTKIEIAGTMLNKLLLNQLPEEH